MSYLVDGHNLIPKLGLHLEMLDDEAELIHRLQEFCRLKRTQVDVYFDGAPPGQLTESRSGSVVAHYVRKGSTADAAIENRLGRLGKGAKNWTVVSSDRRVQRAAGSFHAKILSSEDFAAAMKRAEAERGEQAKSTAEMSPGDVEEWIEAFNKKKDK